MYSKEQINELKSKVNYYDFYSRYISNVPTNKTKVFVPCPFHTEQKPSFQIDLQYGLWHCWGACNTGGDIFSFYKKYFNTSFNEAVEQIAEMYNYELIVSDEERERRDYRKKLLDINKYMCEKFQLSLESDNNAYNYLTQIRGLSPKIIEDFKIGCGINKLPDKESLKILGLLVKNDKDEYYSKFRKDRVVFPRFDEYGNVLSFTGRLCVDKDGAKYMHTNDTEIYKKSEHLFGLYQAKKYIKHFNSAIIMEGNIDVIKCHQKGIVNSVGLDGLNISEQQVNLLKKYANNFYICVEDGAMLKPNSETHLTPLDKIFNNIKQYIPYSKIYVLDLRGKNGEKCDPDMYFENHTKEDFNELIKNAKIYNEFIINSKISNINPKNIEEKNACLNMLVPYLYRISNFLDRKQYIELVSNKLMISENDIYKKLKFYDNKQEKVNNDNISWDSKPVYAQKILLSILFCNKFNTFKSIFTISSKATEYMEPYYKNIIFDLLVPYISNATKETGITVDYSKFFNELEYDENISDNIKETIRSCYLKSDFLEEFDEDDLQDLVEEQIQTLQEWSVPDNSTKLEYYLSEIAV